MSGTERGTSARHAFARWSSLVATLGVAACGARTALLFDTESDAGPATKDAAVVPLRSLDAGDARAVEAGMDAAETPVTDAGEDAAKTSATDAGTDAAKAPASDAATDASSTTPCDDGLVAGSIFGRVRYFASGARLPAGRYRVTYVGGCMKYSGGQSWTVNATTPSTPGGTYSWWIVGATSSDPLIIPPGTLGYEVGAGGYATYEACIAANAQDPSIDFDFDGGRIGVWLDDAPYTDNVAGPDGGTPTWKLGCAN